MAKLRQIGDALKKGTIQPPKSRLTLRQSETNPRPKTIAFCFRRKALGYSRKKVAAVDAVVFAGAQATTLETCAQSHTDTSPSARASPRVLSLREPLASRALLWFRMDSPSGAYCCARKQCCSLKCSSRMAGLPYESEILVHQKAASSVQMVRPFAYSCIFGSTEAAGMISASSPSISRNCLAVTKPMVRPAFLVSRTQAIFSMSHLLGRRLSS
jgi:hypothetical protein